MSEPHPQEAMGLEQSSPLEPCRISREPGYDSSTTAHSDRLPLQHREKQYPPKQRRTFASALDHALLNLAPSFFSLNMGTGIVSILLYNLPYNAEWLRQLGIVIFVLNIVIFALLCVGNIARYIRFKGLFMATLNHQLSGMFWGTLPMGLVTIVNMIAIVCVPAWGWRWAQLALGIWWIDVIMAIAVNFGMLFFIFTRQTQTAETVSPAWLLPIVSSVVAAASGGVISTYLAPFSPTLARSTIIVSYVVWGTGVPPALFIITLWIYRAAIHGIPAAGALPSVFLPLGPCGQGSFGILLLGKMVRTLAYEYDTHFTIITGASGRSIADAVYASGLITSLILWGLGLVWYTLATAFFIDHVLKHRAYFGVKSFSIGFTALTFPIGVWATATTELAAELDSPAFRVIGTIVSVQVVLNWVYVFAMTCWKAWDGTVWVAPELSMFEGERPSVRWGGRGRKEDMV